jgi:CheY-like chemotaxis protein
LSNEKAKKMPQQNLRPILLVDDDSDECRLFQDALQELKIENELLCFQNGKTFLDFIDKNEIAPILTFIDLHIPIVNGIELISKIKGKENFKDTKIALYSNSSSQIDMENAFAAGATFYIQKPNTFEKLKKTIEDSLKENTKY